MSATRTPYTREMVMIHRVFRRESAQLQRAVGATATGDVTRARQLAEVVREYIGGLHHHNGEESLVMPLVEEHLTLVERERAGKKGLENLPKNKVFLALDAILEEATPEERAEFTRRVPLPGRIAWKLIGQRQYRNWRTMVGGEAK